jgi:hypothetical protein
VIRAPFTPEQIEALNAWQRNGQVHPYTCGNAQCRAEHHHVDGSVLVATTTGWVCEHCGYTQEWAHELLP